MFGVSYIREMCTLCAHLGRGAHIEKTSHVSRFRETMCGCAPKISIYRVARMKREEKCSIILLWIGEFGCTPAHGGEKSPDVTPVKMCTLGGSCAPGGHTSTTEVIL